MLLVPVVLSLLVLGAHFYREGSVVLLAMVIFLLAVLAIRHPVSARLVQLGLVIGTVEWLWTLFVLAGQRMEVGAPYLRLALILGGVAAFTLLSALAFEHRSLRRLYRRDRREPGSRA